MERLEKEDAQKAKLVFISLAAVVIILVVWSIAIASRAKSERNAARQELETVKLDNAKLEQMVTDLNQENRTLKKRVQQLEAKAKAGPKPAAAKKKAPARSASKKTTRRSR